MLLRFLARMSMAMLFIGLATTSPAADLRTFDDAELHAVQFIDEHEGWAVGDQGTIWHTIDGGKSWERQSTGVRATLTGIEMRDYRIGWITARESIPYNPGSTGQILWTRDGGGKWVIASRQSLSGLEAVRFVDENKGWVVGQTTDQHPTGVFHTADGARSWEPIRAGRFPGWLTECRLPNQDLLIGGHRGTIARVSADKLTVVQTDWPSASAVRAIKTLGNRIWAVGDQCTVFYSDDQGKSWIRPELPIPKDAAPVWDFRALSAAGDHLWVVGRPGSVVLHSWDKGTTWKVQRTGQPLPLNSVHFVDSRRGWAVGSLGLILATADGGETWTAQRQADKQAAILWINSEPSRVPLSVVARYGGADGYYNVALAMTAPELGGDNPEYRADRATRFADSFRAIGGAATETRSRFPLRQNQLNDAMETVLDRWNQRHEGEAATELEREMVLAIRMWRPGVIVSDGQEENEQTPGAAALVAMGVRRANQSAADAAAFPEQLDFFGLKPFTPGSLYTRRNDAKPGSGLSAVEFSDRLGETYQDAAQAGLAIDREEFVACEKSAAFTQLATAQQNRYELGAPMTVYLRHLVTVNRRPIDDRAIDPQALAAAKKRAEKRRNLEAIGDAKNLGLAPEQFLASLRQSTEDLDMLQAGQAVFYIGRRYADQGKWEMAAPTFEYLLQVAPQHPLALEAYRWLIAYRASTEARLRSAQAAVVTERALDLVRPDGQATQVLANSLTQVLPEPDAVRKWNQMCLSYGGLLRNISPQAWADPRNQLCLASADRQLGNLDGLAERFSALTASDPAGKWAKLAELEQWHFKKVGKPPRTFALSTSAAEKPYLDGKLDDKCWRIGAKMKLNSADGFLDEQFAVTTIMRHDAEFLYVAAECQYPDATYRKDAVQRTSRDSDLNNADRVEFCLDLDRDYSTYYRFGVDSRGLAFDDCWGDRGWNANWFVAVDRDDKGWRFEAAIPLKDLTDNRVVKGQTWLFSAVRVVPKKGVLSLIKPGDIEPRPECFTHLEFLDEKPEAPKAN